MNFTRTCLFLAAPHSSRSFPLLRLVSRMQSANTSGREAQKPFTSTLKKILMNHTHGWSMPREENTIRIEKGNHFFEGSFDRVFKEETSQEVIYESVRSAVGNVLKGYNASILAYGQTNTGKTHTMMGPGPQQASSGISSDGSLLDDAGAAQCTPAKASKHSKMFVIHGDMKRMLDASHGIAHVCVAGVIPRAMADLFASAARTGTEPEEDSTLSIEVSYLQIYNEKVRGKRHIPRFLPPHPLAAMHRALQLLTDGFIFFETKVYDLLVAPAPPPSKPGSVSKPSSDLDVRCVDDVMMAVGR